MGPILNSGTPVGWQPPAFIGHPWDPSWTWNPCMLATYSLHKRSMRPILNQVYTKWSMNDFCKYPFQIWNIMSLSNWPQLAIEFLVIHLRWWIFSGVKCDKDPIHKADHVLRLRFLAMPHQWCKWSAAETEQVRTGDQCFNMESATATYWRWNIVLCPARTHPFYWTITKTCFLGVS